jgi:hypothetical protein
MFASGRAWVGGEPLAPWQEDSFSDTDPRLRGERGALAGDPAFLAWAADMESHVEAT